MVKSLTFIPWPLHTYSFAMWKNTVCPCWNSLCYTNFKEVGWNAISGYVASCVGKMPCLSSNLQKLFSYVKRAWKSCLSSLVSSASVSLCILWPWQAEHRCHRNGASVFKKPGSQNPWQVCGTAPPVSDKTSLHWTSAEWERKHREELAQSSLYHVRNEGEIKLGSMLVFMWIGVGAVCDRL